MSPLSSWTSIAARMPTSSVEISTSASADRLGQRQRPVGQRRRVDDLVHLPVALAPDQLAGIIDGDDDQDRVEAALIIGTNDERERIGRHPEKPERSTAREE